MSWDHNFESTFSAMLRSGTSRHHSICSLVGVVRKALPQHKEIIHAIERRIMEVPKTSPNAKAAWFVLDAILKDCPWLFTPDVAEKLPALVEKHLDWDVPYAMTLFLGWRKLFAIYAAVLLSNLEGRMKTKLQEIAKKQAPPALVAKRPREETVTAGQQKILDIIAGKMKTSLTSSMSAAQQPAAQEIAKETVVPRYNAIVDKLRRAAKLGHIPSKGSANASKTSNNTASTIPAPSSAILPTSNIAPTFRHKVPVGGTASVSATATATKKDDAGLDGEYIPKYAKN